MHPNFGPIIQHNYVVRDAAKTARQWAERMGLGPFYITDQHIDEYRYRGKPVDLELRIAVSYWRDIQIELIEPLSGGNTWYSYSLKKTPEKLNHYATLVPDIDTVVRDLELEQYVVHTGGMPGLKFAYLEEYLPDGTTLELMQAQEGTLQGFSAAMQAVCRTWDGTRPVRKLEELKADFTALRPPT